MRWWLLLRSLWPAILVWLLIAFPSTAWSSYRLRRQDWLALPWWVRAGLWMVEHTWPYSRVARAGARWARWDDELAEARRASRCPVCGRDSGALDHLLGHFPGEDEAWRRQWFTPPEFSTAEAEAWLARREPGGAL